jgi:hypothetical protein
MGRSVACSSKACTVSVADSSSTTNSPLVLSTRPHGASRILAGTVSAGRGAERIARTSLVSIVACRFEVMVVFISGSVSCLYP